MEKEPYKKPVVKNYPNEIITASISGALVGAALMVGRSVAAAMKGGIDLVAGTNTPNVLQEKLKEDASKK